MIIIIMIITVQMIIMTGFPTALFQLRSMCFTVMYNMSIPRSLDIIFHSFHFILFYFQHGNLHQPLAVFQY